MSTFLRENATPGAAMEFVGPSGSFYLREIRRPLLLLAGGTGLAPFLSMLGKIAETGTNGQPVRMVYGVTNDADLVGLDQLEALATRIPDFAFATCVAAQQSTHQRKGYVTAHITPDDLNGGEVDVYLCGPPPMVGAVRGWLTEQAFAPQLLLRKILAEWCGARDRRRPPAGGLRRCATIENALPARLRW